MLKQLCIFIFLAICFFASATQISAEETQKSFAPDRIIIKFKTDGLHTIASDLETPLNQKKSIKSLTNDQSDSLDKLNKKFKVKKAKRLFKLREGYSPQDEKKQMSLSRKKIKTTLKARAIKANPSAAEEDLSNIYVLEVENGQNIEQLIKEYAKDSHVEFVQPDYIMETNYSPNDPYYVDNTLWGLKNIQMSSAWDKSRGDGVVVAVVDSGVAYTHPDLASNMWINTGEIQNGLDDDGNGYIDDIKGYDFTTCRIYYPSCVIKVPDNDPIDINGHGTHVAGTIAAIGNNNLGVIGVAPNAKIMPLKGMSDDGRGLSSELSEAIVYAAHNGADVINNSWGCQITCISNEIIEAAVREAFNLGITVVFAAGNNNLDISNISPQNMPEVITVAATDLLNKKSSYSHFGVLIDAAAPGNSIMSTLPSTSYGALSGTSMAAPHIAGVCALILSKNPSFTPEDVRQVIRGSVDEFDPNLLYPFIGFGRINASKALNVTSVLQTHINPLPNNGIYFAEDNYVVINGDAYGQNFSHYQLFYKLDRPNESWIPVENSISHSVHNGLLGTLDIRNLAMGRYLLRLTATTTSGSPFNDITTMTIDGPDQPPYFLPMNDKNILINQAMTINILLNDPNASDSLDLSVEYPSGPFGGTLTDNGDGIGKFTWTPNAQQIGDFPIIFKGTDSHTTVSQLVTIHVSDHAIPSEIISPQPGSTLTETPTTFTWSSGSGATSYFLNVVGERSARTTETSALIDIDLYRNRTQPLTVILYSYAPNGSTIGIKEYTYYVENKKGAQLKTPALDTVITSPTTTFSWDPVPGATSYSVTIYELNANYKKRKLPKKDSTSVTFTDLPLYGNKLHVVLTTKFKGGISVDNVYDLNTTAAFEGSKLTSHHNGDTLSSTTATFEWSSGNGVLAYKIYIVGHKTKPYTLILSRDTHSLTLTNIPLDGKEFRIYIYSKIQRDWVLYFYTLKKSNQ